MAPELFEVSVPGSLMLMGEHAVLQGKQAIVCAVNQRLRVRLLPNDSKIITINDTRLGSHQYSLQDLQIQDPFKFVLRAILQFKDQIYSGFNLNIESEFSSVIGFGSSAAVTVATVAVIAKWLGTAMSQDEIFQRSYKVILDQQKIGSGADVAASVYGGVVAYSLDDSLCAMGDASGRSGRIRKHSASQMPNFTAIYCGYKTATPEVIKIVQAAQQQQPAKFAAIFNNMHECATQAISAIQNADWQELGQLFTKHHHMQAQLGTSDAVLDDLVDRLLEQPQVYGAKISGAGLGDCVIVLTSHSETPNLNLRHKMQQFQIQVDPQGLLYASN